MASHSDEQLSSEAFEPTMSAEVVRTDGCGMEMDDADVPPPADTQAEATRRRVRERKECSCDIGGDTGSAEWASESIRRAAWLRNAFDASLTGRPSSRHE